MASRLPKVAMCLVAFFSYLTVGLLAPFLPQHLDAMGLDGAVWSGIIFAFYPIAVILTTPLANALVTRYGRVPLISIGLLIQAAAAFVFGAFGDSIIVLVVSRFAQGCGASASNLAMFALVADIYDDSIGQVMGLNELCIGAGFSAGPLIGAVLYGLGGFPLPFVVCSVTLAILGMFAPSLRGSDAKQAAQSLTSSAASDKGAIDRLWQACTIGLILPGGLLLLGTIVWGVIDSGFYTVHAANDLRLDQGVIGVNLAAASAAYAVTGPVAGSTADRVGYSTVMILGGSVSAMSLFLLGPAGQPASHAIMLATGVKNVDAVAQWWEFVILIFLGLGQAGMLIPSLGAMKQHVPNTPTATEACVSLFNTFQQAGLVIGPLASSALGAHFNLGNTVIASIIAMYCVMFMLCISRIHQSAALVDPLLPISTPTSAIVTHQLSRCRSSSFSSPGSSPQPNKLQTSGLR